MEHQEIPEKPAFIDDDRRRKAKAKLRRTLEKCGRVAKAIFYIALCTSIFLGGYAGYDYLAERSKIVYVREEVEPPHTYVSATVTAYTSSVDETDEDPFITASGATVRNGTLACPSKYEFGTIVEIDGVRYTCEDRMNKRYRHTERFDIWVQTKRDAFQWGKKQLFIKVYLNS